MSHSRTALAPTLGRSARGLPWRTSIGAWVLSVATAGCLHGQAQTVPEVPLEMPNPPARVVVVSQPHEPPIISLPDEPVPNTPVRPRPTPSSRTDARPADVRSDAPEAARPPDDTTRTTPAPTLQTTPVQWEGEAERRIRASLAQATGDLNRINVQSLNADARQQFETARRFVTQAEEALRTRNQVFAGNLAEKAAALAAQLAGR